jgi:hypothetical protein
MLPQWVTYVLIVVTLAYGGVVFTKPKWYTDFKKKLK